MKLSLSSTIKDSIKESANLAANLGLGIEISRFPNFKNIDTELENIISQTKYELQDFTGLITLHGMFFDESIASNDPAIREISRRRHHQSFEMAKAINAKNVVYHSGHKGMKHKGSLKKFTENSILYWREFIKEFEDAGITVSIENVLERTPDIIYNIVNEVNSPFLNYTIDIGHANLFTQVPICNWIKKYGKKLHHLHIHNNFGDDDSHNALANGSVNYNEIFKTIKEVDIDPIYILEMYTKQNLTDSLNYLEQLKGLDKCIKN